MRRKFYWDAWNREHVAKHSVSEGEAEFVVRHAKRPYPREVGEGKSIVWGPTTSGRMLQVLFVDRRMDEMDYELLTLEQIAELEDSSIPRVYIIHARDLTHEEKSQYRRFA